MLKHSIILVLSMFMGLMMLGQRYNPNILIQRIGKEQGLSQSRIMDIVQDQEGYIWLATMGGLNRFDGYRCKAFHQELRNPNSISDDRTSALLVTKEGILWVGTVSGAVHVYQPESESFLRVDSTQELRKVFDSEISSMMQMPNGDILFGRGNGEILSLDLQSGDLDMIMDPVLEFPEVLILENSEMTSFAMGGDASVWCAIAGIGIYAVRPDGKGLDRERFAFDLKWIGENVSAYPDGGDPVTGIQAYPDGKLLATFGSQSYLFDPISEVFELMIPGEEHASYPFADNKGNIWFETSGRIRVFENLGKDSSSISPLGGGSDFFNFKNLIQDRTGLIWGHDDFSAFYFDPQPLFELYSQNSMPPYRISAISIRGIRSDEFRPGKLLISGYDGIDIVEPGRGRMDLDGKPADVPVLDQHAYNVIQLSADSILFCGDFSGLSLADLRTGKIDFFLRNSFPRANGPQFADDFYAMLSHKGKIWLGAKNGIYSYDPQRGIAQYEMPHIPEGEWEHRVWALFVGPEGKIWGGTERGIIWVDPESHSSGWQPLIPGETVFVKSFHLRNQHELWLGTSGQGLLMIDLRDFKGAAKRVSPKVLGIGDGLPDNVIYGILEDVNNRLWLSTNNGLARYDPENGEVLCFGAAFGLQDLEFNTASWFRANNGYMYFGGLQGITAFNPDSLLLFEEEAPLVFTGFGKYGKPMDLPATVNAENKLEMDAGESIFTLEFALMDFFAPKSRKFGYKLSGLHEDWIDLGARHSITFTGLNHGIYQLEIRVSDRYGRWYPGRKVLEITIRPYWYQHSLFPLVLILLFLAVTIAVYMLRVRQVRSQNRKLEAKVVVRTNDLKKKSIELEKVLKEREALLREVHHRVKNNMEVISSLLNLQAATFDDERLRQAMEESRARIQSMALVHQKLYQTELFTEVHLQEYLESLISAVLSGFQRPGLQLLTSVKAEGITLEVDTAIPLGLIVNELLTNVFKYAFQDRSKGRVQISVNQVETGQYLLSFSDDGIGLPEGFDLAKPQSLGIQIVQDLVHQLHGDFSLKSRDGTHVFINFRDGIARKREN